MPSTVRQSAKKLENLNEKEEIRKSQSLSPEEEAKLRNEYTTIPSSIPYALVMAPIPLAVLDFYRFFGPVSPWGTLLYLFVLLPIIDIVSGHDFSNPSSKIMFKLERAMGFRIVTWVFAAVYAAYMYWAIKIALPEVLSDMERDSKTTSGDANQYNLFIPVRYWGLILGTGAVNAKAILTAHELIHKLNFVEHWMGNLMLIGSSFVQYSNVHLLGHHRDIGYKHDATCADENDIFWVYLFRNVIVYIINAFKLDFKKACVLFTLWGSFVYFCIPREAYLFFFGASFVGQAFLLAADYLEHWGLNTELFRKPGEGVHPMLSWSDNTPATSSVLLRVNVHAHHHSKGGLRYQSLRSHAYSPQLPPYGYSFLILMVLIPPLFFKTMNPRLEKAKQVMKQLRESGDIEKVWTDEYQKENSFEKDFKKVGWF